MLSLLFPMVIANFVSAESIQRYASYKQLCLKTVLKKQVVILFKLLAVQMHMPTQGHYTHTTFVHRSARFNRFKLLVAALNL